MKFLPFHYDDTFFRTIYVAKKLFKILIREK